MPDQDMTGAFPVTGDDPTPGHAALAAKVTAIQQANDRTLAGLAAQGVQFGPDLVLGTRLYMLLDTLLGPIDEQHPARLEYELAFQRRVATLIADAETQIARAKLLQGVHLGNGNRRPPLPGKR